MFANYFDYSRNFIKLFFCIVFTLQWSDCWPKHYKWPIPYQRYSSRSKPDSYCQPFVAFCPTGSSLGGLPPIQVNDTYTIYSMKTPVWEDKLGELLKFANIMHDAIGFKSHNTGVNFTLEWYELFQLFNSTFPHVINDSDLLWCNQGASCAYVGINDTHWSKYGSLQAVGEISGSQLIEYGKWLTWDNNTGLYYETWDVVDKADGQAWFTSFDCADFVLRSYTYMHSLGVHFNHSIHINYTDIVLYSSEPVNLGTLEDIRKNNVTLFQDMILFFTPLQPQVSLIKVLEEIAFMMLDARLLKHFYFYYNEQYWYLQLHEPYIRITYDEVPLP